MAVVGTALAMLLLGGCGHKDATMCDFEHALAVNWVHMKGYVPSDVQDSIDEYC